MAVQKVKIGLDKIRTARSPIVVKSIAKGGPFESVLVKEGIDHFSVVISDTLRYSWPGRWK